MITTVSRKVILTLLGLQMGNSSIALTKIKVMFWPVDDFSSIVHVAQSVVKMTSDIFKVAVSNRVQKKILSLIIA